MILYIFTPSQLFLFIVLMVFGAFLTTFLHELSHLIVVKLADWQMISFKPFPHKYQGNLCMGACYYRHNHKNIHFLPWAFSAPLYKSYIFFTVWSLLGLLYVPLFAFLVAEIADYCSWWAGYLFQIKDSDGFKLRYITKVMRR